MASTAPVIPPIATPHRHYYVYDCRYQGYPEALSPATAPALKLWAGTPMIVGSSSG
jgi:hypothetical protein